ncbi:MAG: phosphate acyltransferase PlsX [Ectothiorhodospira sp.]
MSGLFTIALDAMGGDHGPQVVVPAALRALAEFSDIHLILVGDKERLARELSACGEAPSNRLRIHHAAQVVGMDEPPSQALRTKKDSSMRVAVNLVKHQQADACVSAGNTGALMATSRYVLKTLPGIDRPAIITAIPALNGHTHMLDLGANVDSTANHLYQFAVMGSELASAVDNLDAPRVGLLNIGEEDIKGNDQVKEAAHMLEHSHLNYVGFVEGNDIFCGEVDLVVCDGFVGNVALKTSEGVARMVSHYVRSQFTSGLYAKMAGLVAMPVLKALRRRIDPRAYNGASLLGLQGVVIKSHGGADAVAFLNAIRIARVEAEKRVPQRIDKRLEELLNQEGTNP